jgi:integrase
MVALLRAKLRREHKPRRVTPHSALDYREVPAFVSTLQTQGGIAARCLEFTILTAARTGESIGAKWAELDTKAALCTISAERMKAGEPQVVHLSERALAKLTLASAIRSMGSSWASPSIFRSFGGGTA